MSGADPADLAGALGSSSVLLVEDDGAARHVLEEPLRDEGHTVNSAATGIDAERLWREGWHRST